MSEVRGVERGLADGCDGGYAAVEDVSRGEKGESCVVMVVVVPGEEIAEPGAAMECGPEATGVVRLAQAIQAIEDSPANRGP